MNVRPDALPVIILTKKCEAFSKVLLEKPFEKHSVSVSKYYDMS